MGKKTGSIVLGQSSSLLSPLLRVGQWLYLRAGANAAVVMGEQLVGKCYSSATWVSAHVLVQESLYLFFFF